MCAGAGIGRQTREWMGQLTGVGSTAKPSICGAQHSSGPSLKVSIHCQTRNRDSWRPLVASVGILRGASSRGTKPPSLTLKGFPGCNEHWGTRVSFNSGFLGVYVQQWAFFFISRESRPPPPSHPPPPLQPRSVPVAVAHRTDSTSAALKEII